MHPNSLISALVSHMQSLESYVTSALVIAVVTYWSALFENGPIEILGLKVNRRYASFVTGLAFLFINVAVLLSFVRVNALLRAVPNDHFAEAVTKLATNSWLLNPFSFFGAGNTARVVSGWGFGGLIVVWWFSNTSFSLLQERDPRISPQGHRLALAGISALFLLIGLMTMGAVQSTYTTIMSRGMRTLPADLYDSILSTEVERQVCAFIGIGVGGLIFFLSNVARSVLVKEQESATGETACDDLTSSAEPNPSGSPVVMRSLPLHLSGWNGGYQLTKETRNGRGVWARRSHWYKGFLPLRIIGVTIWFDGKTWVLKRDCDAADVAMVRSQHTHDTPVGKWEGRTEVVPGTVQARAEIRD